MSLYTSRHPLAGVSSFLFNVYVRAYLRPKVEGREYLPAEGAFIIAANHSSHADTAVLFAVLPRRLRRHVVAAAAQDYFFQGGAMQNFARMLYNVIPVSRDPKVRGKDPLRHVVRALREGYGVLMYPEGTRSVDGTIGTFKPGIGRLIAEFPGLPVIPTRIVGTARVLPKGKTVPRPFKVKVFFGAPLELRAHLHYRATWQSVANQIRDAVLQLGPQTVVATPVAEAEEPRISDEGDEPL